MRKILHVLVTDGHDSRVWSSLKPEARQSIQAPTWMGSQALGPSDCLSRHVGRNLDQKQSTRCVTVPAPGKTILLMIPICWALQLGLLPLFFLSCWEKKICPHSQLICHVVQLINNDMDPKYGCQRGGSQTNRQQHYTERATCGENLSASSDAVPDKACEGCAGPRLAPGTLDFRSVPC